MALDSILPLVKYIRRGVAAAQLMSVAISGMYVCCVSVWRV